MKPTFARALLLLAAIVLLIGTLFHTGVLWFNMPSRQEYPVWGVDVSNWQGEIDWPILAAEGMGFAFIKATEGKGFTDARFEENWRGAREAGLLVGAYHFLTGSSTGVQQAEHFIATVPRQAGMLPPVIDIEVGVSLPGINDILDEMIAMLEAHYGVPPILYVTHDTYDAFVAGRYAQCPIWIRDVMKKPTLSDRRAWLLWQYSNRGRMDGYEGEETYIDLNVFAGSREELEVLAVAAAQPIAQSPSTTATTGGVAAETSHDNPIDAYYLPRMNQVRSGIEHRQLQDEYGVAWKTEFYNILAWMKEKCSYPVDIDRLDDYAAAVEAMIDAAHIVLVTDWLDDYPLPPDDPDRYAWGNGTRSGLNKEVGNIYRSAGMSLIVGSGDYVFLQHDYAQLHYEDLSPWHKSDYCQSSARLEYDNPIDNYFQVWGQGGLISSFDIRAHAYHYSESWKAELLEAYRRLESLAHPGLVEERYVAHAQEGFIEYVENDGWLYGYAKNSSAFEGRNDNPIGMGLLLPATAYQHMAERYRAQTLYLMDLIYSLRIEEGMYIQPQFIFDAAAMDALREEMVEN